MSTLYVFVVIVTFSTSCSGYVVSHSETDRSIASVILKEGQSAEISCMTKGTGDYFWRKGETLHNSTLVASFTLGEVSDDSQPYSVTENGTLHIKSVTLKDEGNYFCRLSSTENECYGEVNILVQASLFNFDLAIDRCDRQSSCLLYLDPSQSTSLTCTALNAPPLMTLKWFNGSKEITEGIVQNELLPPNGNSREITSTVAAVYGRPASFTCQAVDPKRSNDDVRFAHAQVEMTEPTIETLPSWIIVSVTLAGCFIVFGIFLLIKAMVNREQRKKYTKVKKEDDESLKKKVKTNEEAINAKHQELTEFKVSAVSKDSELNELKGKLSQTEEEQKKSRRENIELQTKVAKYEANIKSAEENLVSKAKSIAELECKLQQTEKELKKKSDENIGLHKTISNALGNDRMKTTIAETLAHKQANEITELKDLLKQQKVEIKQERNENVKLRKTIASSKGETIVAEELVERKNEEITKLKESVKQKDKEINKQRERFLDCQTNLQKEKIALQGKSDDIDKLKDNLRQQEEEIKKERNAIVKLQETIASSKVETTVAEGLAERKNKEISELKETVKQKDKEINNQSEQYRDCQTNLQKKEIALEGKRGDISNLKGNLTEKDNELAKIKKELDKLKEELTQKDHTLQDLYKESRKPEKGSHRRHGKNEKGN